MLVPFCNVQRRSTGSVLPALGCIFKITRQVPSPVAAQDLVVHNRRVGAAIGNRLREIAFGNGVEFRPVEINHELPDIRDCPNPAPCAWTRLSPRTAWSVSLIQRSV